MSGECDGWGSAFRSKVQQFHPAFHRYTRPVHVTSRDTFPTDRSQIFSLTLSFKQEFVISDPLRREHPTRQISRKEISIGKPKRPVRKTSRILVDSRESSEHRLCSFSRTVGTQGTPNSSNERMADRERSLFHFFPSIRS